MYLEILTLFPHFFKAFFKTSMVKKAIQEGFCNYRITQLRNFGIGKHAMVDDTPYGGIACESYFYGDFAHTGVVAKGADISALQALELEGGGGKLVTTQPLMHKRTIRKKNKENMQKAGKGMLLRSDVVLNALQAVDEKRMQNANGANIGINIGANTAKNRTLNNGKQCPCCETFDAEKPHKILLTPRGKLFSGKMARRLSKKNRLLFVCGHYEGVDARVEEMVDEQISIGDYVTFSGEVAALVLMEAILRLLPGVLGSNTSSLQESFENGLLEYDQFTKPAQLVWQNKSLDDKTESAVREKDALRIKSVRKVPAVLKSGHHRHISQWRRFNAIYRTYCNRPDLLAKAKISNEECWQLAGCFENVER